MDQLDLPVRTPKCSLNFKGLRNISHKIFDKHGFLSNKDRDKMNFLETNKIGYLNNNENK